MLDYLMQSSEQKCMLCITVIASPSHLKGIAILFSYGCTKNLLAVSQSLQTPLSVYQFNSVNSLYLHKGD